MEIDELQKKMIGVIVLLLGLRTPKWRQRTECSQQTDWLLSLLSERNNSASTQSSRGGTTQEDHQSKVSAFKTLYRPCQPNAKWKCLLSESSKERTREEYHSKSNRENNVYKSINDQSKRRMNLKRKEIVKWGTKTWRHQPLPTSKYDRLLFQEEPIFVWRWYEIITTDNKSD